ncbi:hypothetical protein VFPFJ_00261 [Purpureocillium lilacinum]|uniref:Uncharacterized protein n=1 Tax=Purpureocillium lilacinum TaxID=33203 RepID=A0A179H9K8_PURLI|nr:hypothetical protein VFPFJ_00261 [Purpureocillium lilacinum]OAQ86193.1 hypothetical protein VFPBJ_00233 [Purpureocillium lilacinum]OAQ94152.1 hypothetical protein VFPFJ_00261 [Purpureocillium lilacinum]
MTERPFVDRLPFSLCRFLVSLPRPPAASTPARPLIRPPSHPHFRRRPSRWLKLEKFTTVKEYCKRRDLFLRMDAGSGEPGMSPPRLGLTRGSGLRPRVELTFLT